ncbi:MAG: phenylacetate--CoA ligase family protein, partial [Acidobacteria bacterium]|nr:phenylacetate--CoA ligase family protein [Acidobacteriota bacterium]
MSFDYGELPYANRSRLRDWQDERLRWLLSELESNQFYQGKFHQAGMDGSQVRDTKDLSALPFTTKAELAAEQLAHPPYGRLLSYPVSRYRYLHQTSGTTGRSMQWLDTAEDWEVFMRCWAEVYRGAGVTPDDLVFCAFSFGPYISHWSGIDGARHIGALALSGGGMHSEQRLRAILDNRCT